MRTIVLYSSKGGNTEKVASEIASELKCESVKITKTSPTPKTDLENFDLIIVGTGIHYGNPYDDLIDYLNKLTLETPKTFALFITWGGAGRTNQIATTRLVAILESKHQTVHKDFFSCYGGWRLLERGHPNNEDFKAARNWAKNLVASFLK